LDGSQVKADPFTRGACAEASAGAITCIIWCNTSQYTPLQALSPRRRAAARIPSWTCLGDLRKSVASDINIHVSNPRVPSPASKALALALKTKEATRDDRRRSWQLVLHKSEHLRPYFIHALSVKRRISRGCNLGYNLVAGARFEVNARGIITRDDKLQTAYEKQLYHRAKFYALNRCPRDARGAGTICQTDPFERISVLRHRH